MSRRRLWGWMLVLPGALLVSASLRASSLEPALSQTDRAAVAATIESYRAAWLAGDSERVLAPFLPDAVFLPHHGLDPVVGLPALTAFWFPGKGPKVTILRFDLETTRVEGAGDVAYAWGRQRLEWSQEDAQGIARFRTHGTHLTILRRTAEGWRIAVQMGDDVPNERY